MAATPPHLPPAAGPSTRGLGWPTLLALWSVPAAVSALQAYTAYALRGEDARNWLFVAVQAAAWLAWAPLTPVVRRLTARWPVAARAPGGAWRLHPGAVARHAGAGIGVSLLHAAATVAGFLAAEQVVGPATRGRMPLAAAAGGAIMARLLTGLLTYAAVVAAGTAADSLGRLGAEEVRAARMAEQLATARLGALKMQLHPHFLFNTLHAVTVLLREDPPAAARMVTRLGDLLRLTLSRAERAEVALDDELTLVRLYLDIEAVRFADRLVVAYDVADDLRGARVPDLALQPLVENAIGHGIAARRDAGRLAIRARRTPRAEDLPAASVPPGGWLVLEVEDDGPGPAAGARAGGALASGGLAGGALAGGGRTSGCGIGLASTRERLAALYGAAHTACVLHALPGRGCLARLTLPYVATDAHEARHATAHDAAA